MTLEQALAEKIRQFLDNRQDYENPKFKEASVRAQFIDPLFRALGWDVYNDKGISEQYKEVELEPSQDILGKKRNPDYAFRIDGVTKFYVEAKKPAVRLHDHVESALQIRRYSWSAQLPLGILTDFAEFAVYDCRVPPRPTDHAGSQRIMYLTVEGLEERWGELSDILSFEAVRKGSLEQYAAEVPEEQKSQAVDKVFLADIERWRRELAQDVFLRNPQLSSRSLSYVVQATLDRIVFLRICEDRGTESPELVRVAVDSQSVYRELMQIFKAADDRYNSGLFHFSKERGRPQPPDLLSPKIEIGNSVLRNIILGLYPPISPYAFSTIGIDILGQVYEQFLSRIITTSGGEVRIEVKLEVAKAGGIVYTPAWVTELMVAEALGTALKDVPVLRALGRSNNAPLRVLDPACGSGSFLIKIYDFLLSWFLDKYQQASSTWGHGRDARIHQLASGEWRLTSQERKRIVTDHIYGVDIDPQAVEVTKLSLLLKVLDGETKESLDRQLSLFHERALPDLDNNIRCGNSLVDSDVCRTLPIAELSESEERRINPFDWETEFVEPMACGGFDVVIGNPPYLSYSGRQAVNLTPMIRDYFARKYAASGWPTAHTLFMERAVRDLSRRLVCFIVPDQVGHLHGYSDARAVITRSSSLVSVRYMGEQVFPGRVTPALIFLADRSYAGDTAIYSPEIPDIAMVKLDNGDEWVVFANSILLAKVRINCFSLGKYVADPGVHTGNCSRRLILPADAATKDSVPILEGKQVSRYRTSFPRKVLRLSYRASEGEYYTIRPKHKYVDAPFVIRQTAAEPIVGPRRHAEFFRNTLLALYPMPGSVDVRYVVALLNSKLLRWVYRTSTREAAQKTFPQVKVRALRALPIRALDLKNGRDRNLHGKIVDLTDRLLKLNFHLDGSISPDDERTTMAKISATDRQLDTVVYELYELTSSEVDIIESSYSQLLTGVSQPDRGHEPVVPYQGSPTHPDQAVGDGVTLEPKPRLRSPRLK